MSKEKEVLYILLEKNSEVSKRDVYLSDVAKMACSNENMLSRIKGMKLLKVPAVKKYRQVFNVIDARSRSGKPMIITTNLSLTELNNPKDLEHKRIYDRIKVLCPVNFGSNGRRAEQAQEKRRMAAELLRGD